MLGLANRLLNNFSKEVLQLGKLNSFGLPLVTKSEMDCSFKRLMALKAFPSRCHNASNLSSLDLSFHPSNFNVR